MQGQNQVVARNTQHSAGSYTVNEVAQILGFDKRTIYRHIDAKSIHAFKLGYSWRIPAAEVDRIMGGGSVAE